MKKSRFEELLKDEEISHVYALGIKSGGAIAFQLIGSTCKRLIDVSHKDLDLKLEDDEEQEVKDEA